MTFLDVLEPQERALIETYLRPVRFRQGDCIIRQGDPGDGCYLIDEGEVRLELLDVETDSDSVLGYLDPGMFLGEFSLIDGESRSSFAYAHTDVRARYFSQADFQELCERYPGVGLTISNAMARNLTAKLRGYVGRMTEYLFADAADAATDAMVARARLGQRELACWPEERVDALLEALAKAVAERAEELAQACVEETRIGQRGPQGGQDPLRLARRISLSGRSSGRGHAANRPAPTYHGDRGADGRGTRPDPADQPGVHDHLQDVDLPEIP